MRRWCIACWMLVLLVVPGIAQASLVGFDFSGSITQVSGGLAGYMHAGDLYTGSIIYDTANPNDKFKTTLTIGSYTNVLEKVPNVTPMIFGYSVTNSGGTTTFMMGGSGATASQVELINLTAKVLNSSGKGDISGIYTLQNISAAPPTLAGYSTFTGSIDASSSHPVSSTPIPAAVWLLGTGVAGLFGLGRRYRKDNRNA